MKRWVNNCLDGLFPQHCLLCRAKSQRRLPLCFECENDLVSNRHCCNQCALPLPPAASDPPRYCGQCLRSPPPFDSTIAPYVYQEHLALLVQQWKYARQQRLSPLMGALWLTGLTQPLPPVDLIAPVPLHWRKLWQRGFNQSLQLAYQLQRNHPPLCDVPLSTRLIRRTRPTDVQAGLQANERIANLRHAFALRKHCDNLRIALVDDVITTGSTARELAGCLKAGGAAEVHLWCLGRTPAPSSRTGGTSSVE